MILIGQYGDVRGVVRACKSKGIELTTLEQIKLSVQIAAGMAYLAGMVLLDCSTNQITASTLHLSQYQSILGTVVCDMM